MPEPLVDLAFVDHVLEIAWRRDSHLHGEAHWHAVTSTGLDLAAYDPDVDAELVFLFGLLHDTRRRSDGRDGGHGPRAAVLALELHADGLLLLEQDRLELLAGALERHAFGEVSTDPSVGTCWDSDRLHLPRVGFAVDPAFLSTEPARRQEALAAAGGRRADPIAWATMLERLV